MADLVDPAAVGQNITSAFQAGMEMRQKRETQGALAAYVANPSPQTALHVAMNDPLLGLQLRQQQAQQAQAEQVKKVRAAAASGDPQALAQLAGVDWDSWMKLDQQQHQQIGERTKYIGQAALRISQLPEEQRPAAWDQAVDQGSQFFPDLAQYKGQYSPQALQGAIDHAGLVQQLIDNTKPQYMAIPEGGTLVDVRKPEAVSQFGNEQNTPTVSDQKSYDAIPAGGKYLDPQGNVRTKPGGTSGNAGGNFPHLSSYYSK